MSNNDYDYEIIVVGAGMAGLRAAIEIDRHTDNYLLLEKQDTVGGRVQTLNQNGYRLDRGFQVVLTEYPELQDVLDYSDLDLKSFKNGSLIRSEDNFISMVDPLSHPSEGIGTVLNEVGTFSDRLLIMKLRISVYFQSISSILDEPETTTEEFLENYGFTEDFIERFFRPFLSGVFLEPELSTSSRMFKFVYKMFSEGNTCLPANGMQQIPKQMAQNLPDSSIRTNKAVKNIESNQVHCVDGDSYSCRGTIVAAGGWELDQLDGLKRVSNWNETSCLYYSLDEPPIEDPILIVNSNRNEKINNLCFPSLVSQNYSPRGKHLLSVSTQSLLESADDRSRIESELVDWFGPRAREWTHLKTVTIPHALPSFSPDTESELRASNMESEDLYVCGDHRETPSLNGAVASGRKTATRALRDLDLIG